jgi:hypothetical protein
LDRLTFNLALTMVIADVAVRLYAPLAGTPLLLIDTLDAHRLVPGQDYGDGLRGNSLGYAGREFEPEKRPGLFRIAALGDSFAIGPAVPFAENYLCLLEQRLHNVEVYNFGVAGTGPREYLAILRHDVWRFRPDLVLVSVFVGNDITERMATPRHLDPRRHSLYLLVTRAARLLREGQRRHGETTGEAPRRMAGLSEETFREVEARRLAVCQTPPAAGLEKKWQQALGSLDQIIAECWQRDTPVAIVLIPDEFQVNSTVLRNAIQDSMQDAGHLDVDGPQRRLAAFAAERQVACLDLLPAFREMTDTYASNDTHWNVRGNRLAAEQLAHWLPGQVRIPHVSTPPQPAVSE